MSGPAELGRGTWPNKDYSAIGDAGLRRACEVAQRLACLVRARVATSEEVARREGYSQRQLARDAGLRSQVTVKQVLEGQHFVRLDTVIRLVTALNVSERDLQTLFSLSVTSPALIDR